MAGPASDRNLLESIMLAAVGAVALTAERVEQLADALAERGGLRREDAVQIVDEVTSRWRGEVGRVGERATANAQHWLHELGVVTKDDLEELELRVAQIELRLRQVEAPLRPVPPAQH
jgi:polyhydroxyalkanoate synthesis regulator phasin